MINGTQLNDIDPPKGLVQHDASRQPDTAAYYCSVFSDDELGYLEQIAMVAKEEGGTNGNTTIRRCATALVNPHKMGWLSARLCRLVSQANAEHFRFRLTGLEEMLQFVRYDATNAGEYDWHYDIRPDFARKLSISVQLTDPQNYDGGVLEMMVAAGNVQALPTARGTVIVFPSYVMHRVSLVKRGTRCALVTWIAGPPFG